MAILKCFGFNFRRSRVPNSRVSDKNMGKIEGVRRFTRSEVEESTMNFSDSRLIANGGFSQVYLAQFPDSTLAAVKITDRTSERLHRVYQQELGILLQIRHENIVNLLGHSEDGDDGILVFEYVSNGTLHEKLHEIDEKDCVIPWRNRMGVAFQLAQAIEYLHEKCALQIVHGDIKASNVLLDKQFNCKLCDFGSAKMGFSSSISPPSSSRNKMIVGTPGYTDPHYLRTGIASKKNDIYSFGVIILQLISGVEAIDFDSGERLITKADTVLRDASKVVKMVDPLLNGDYVLDEAMAMVSLAALCLGDCPSLRPSASEILETMRSRVPSINFLFSVDKKF